MSSVKTAGKLLVHIKQLQLKNINTAYKTVKVKYINIFYTE